MSSKAKPIHTARMAAIGAATATATAAAAVAATLKKPGVTMAELRSAHQSRLDAYKAAAATSRLAK